MTSAYEWGWNWIGARARDDLLLERRRFYRRPGASHIERTEVTYEEIVFGALYAACVMAG